MTPPNATLTTYVYGGRFSILQFPLYDYVSIDAEPDFTVAISLAASAATPVSLTYSPLMWYCDDNTWENWPTDQYGCQWEGEGAPAGYWVDTVIAVGQTLTLSFSSGTNSTLYPFNWYDSPGLWMKFSNDNHNPPALLSITPLLGVEPTATPSASAQVGVPSASVLPSGALAPSTGLLTLLPATVMELVADTYCLTYLTFSVPAAPQMAAGEGQGRQLQQAPLPIVLNVTAEANDLEIWLTPYNFVCPDQGWTNVAWWESEWTRRLDCSPYSALIFAPLFCVFV